jgi:tetraacyldisaccharide 4'-kinase
MKQRSRDAVTRGLNSLWYGGSPLYWLLWPVAIVVRGLVEVRRFAYRKGWIESIDVGVPVVVVGNLTAGGTGKTPLTLWLAGKLAARGYRVGIVCSGYGGAAGKWPQPVAKFSDAALVGDEAILLVRRAGCPVVAGPDRAAAAELLLRPGALDVILADDGLQHYRLRRAVEIAVVDGTRGLGNGLCLPAGPLREPATRLREVDAVVVNQGDWGHSGVLRTEVRAVRLVELATGAEKPLAAFAATNVHAVAAIGNPERFFALLESAGLRVEPHAHADHARLTAADLGFDDAAPVLITEKDAVKCSGELPANVWTVVTELEFAAGDDERLLRILVRLLDREDGNR